MKNKLLILIIGIIASAAMLFSCQIPGLTPPASGGGAEYNRLVYADDSLDLIEVRQALMEINGSVVAITADTEAAVDGEIVFGDTNRAVTAKAKAELSKELIRLADKDVGYIVYSDGKNIAVYWNDDTLADIAISGFISEFLSGTGLDIEKGTAFTDLYGSDTVAEEAAWAKIAATASPELVAVLRELHAYYDGTAIAGWVANLYDPERGGFYYSISARDNEPFRPDIESTSQALSIMGECGATFDCNTDIPESIKADILTFIKSCQSPVDGYFYHPQWPQGKENLNTDRYGRDMSSATHLIRKITLDTNGDGIQEPQYPDYCTLETKCKTHDGTSEKCVFPVAVVKSVTSSIVGTHSLTDAIGVTSRAAVSKVRAASSAVIAAATVSNHPDYSSREAFKTWLYAYNNEAVLRASSGKAHNLAALYPEIYAHGMQDILFDQLDEFQAKLFDEQMASNTQPTGAWQETVDYQTVWGMYKYIHCYNKNGGRALNPKYFPYMVKSALQVINQPLTTNKHMNDIMNQWACISGMIANAKKHNPDAVYGIYDIVREEAVSAISSTITKLEMYKISDGSIGYSTTGKSLTSIYGVPISLGRVEGDCNAVHLCLCLYHNISSCLGYSIVPVMTGSDIEMFTRIISASEPIVKEKMKIPTADFELGVIDPLTCGRGDPGGAEATVVADPDDSSNSVLYFTSPSNNASSNVTMRSTQLGGGCNIFEARMNVDSVLNASTFLQIIMKNTYMLSLTKNGNKVEIYESTGTGSDAKSNKIATVKMNEWFTLRVEHYEPKEDGDTAHIKVWLNGELIVNDSNMFYGAHAVGAEPKVGAYANVELRSMRAAETKIYLDDVYCTMETKTFNPNDSSISDARDNVNQ